MRGVLFLVALGTGCSGGFEGMYQTTGIVTLTAPCTGAAVPQAIPATRTYLDITTSSLGSITVLSVKGCMSMDPATCTASVAGFFAGGGEYYIGIGQQVGTNPCKLRYAEVRLARGEGESIELRNAVHQQEDASVATADCTSELALERGTTLTCEDLTITTAVPVGS